MKTISTLKKLADNIEIESLFHSGGTLTHIKNIMKKYKYRYDLGKYSETIKNREHDKNCPVWYERRTDKDGVYYAIYTIDDHNNNATIQKILNLYK